MYDGFSLLLQIWLWLCFKGTFNNISVISWRSVVLVEETGIPGDNHCQTLSHNVVLSTPVASPERDSNSQH
jgi:hypothetical protein